MELNNSISVGFVKNNGDKINGQNPFMKIDGNSFGFEVDYSLSNVSQIIDAVSTGKINGMPENIANLCSMFAGEALISGEIDLTIDINGGLNKYLTVNQTELDALELNPNSLFSGNTAFLNTFNADSVTMTNGAINVKLTAKPNITGQNLLDLKNNYSNVTLSAANLFTLKPSAWSEVNSTNRGELDNLIEISAPSVVYVVNIPNTYLLMANMFHLNVHNPFVGIQLTTNPGYGQMDFGYAVLYDGNGNTSGTAPSDSGLPYNLDEKATILEKNNLVRDGYVFNGWNTASDGTGVEYLPGASLAMKQNTILYAQWKKTPATVSVSFDSQGGNSVTSETVDYSSLVTKPADPVKTGYTFGGWYTEPTCTNAWDFETGKITGDMTLYAKWFALDNVYINSYNFPDANFLAYVKTLNTNATARGYFTQSEINKISSLYCESKGISSLKGVEFFTSLTYLDCSNNELTSLDVSKNTALTSLSCFSNQLTYLDVSKNTALTSLDCGYNRLTSLNISGSTFLTNLNCSDNQLTSLDVSKNISLTDFDCSDNQLTSLDLSANKKIDYLKTIFQTSYYIGNAKDGFPLSAIKLANTDTSRITTGVETTLENNILKPVRTFEGSEP